ncbi:MAG: hypothetical protein ABSA86_01000 [Oryzomonas sp.]|jgi:hypothetical protein
MSGSYGHSPAFLFSPPNRGRDVMASTTKGAIYAEFFRQEDKQFAYAI